MNLLVKLIRIEEDLLIKTVVTVLMAQILTAIVNISLRIASEYGYFDFDFFKPFLISVSLIVSGLLIVLLFILFYRIHNGDA